MKRLIGLCLVGVVFGLGDEVPSAAQEKSAFLRYELTQKDIDDSLGTDWYGVYVLGNQKIGYAKSTFARTDDAKNPGYRSAVDVKAKVTSAGVSAELDFSEVQEFDAAPPYLFRFGRSVESDGKSKQIIEATRTEQGFEVVTRAAGDKRTKQSAKLDFTLGDALTPIVWIRKGPKAGESITTRNFDFDDLKIDHEIREHVSSKDTVVAGVKVVYHELKVSLPKKKLSGVERYDQTGKLINGKMAGVFEMRLEPEAQAKDLGKSVDLFVLGTVKIDKPLGEATEVAELVVEVSAKQAGVLKSGPRQTVARDGDQTILKLGKTFDAPQKATMEEIDENLEESATYPLTHPKVQALVKQALGDPGNNGNAGLTPEEKVKRLIHFVHGYIKPSYTAQPLTLLDLIEKRRGDCSEYALLFTTLARAVGVPAREVSGLMYMGDRDKAFGPHAWNEVALNGHWVPVDAAWDQFEPDATHISFGAGVSGGLEHLSTFGSLRFRLVSVKKK